MKLIEDQRKVGLLSLRLSQSQWLQLQVHPNPKNIYKAANNLG